ncbi:hypothetical protein V8E53_013648 [Lactarius tabidus]
MHSSLVPLLWVLLVASTLTSRPRSGRNWHPIVKARQGEKPKTACYLEIPALRLFAALVLLIRSLCPNFVSCKATSNSSES